MLVGAHVSVSGGLQEAFHWSREFDCEALQIFTKSQLRWQAKPLEPEDVVAWLEAWEEDAWPPCLVHDSYLINLASPEEEVRQRSVAGFVDELERAALLAIPWVNTHPGSHKGAGLEAGLRNCAKSIGEALEQTRDLGVGVLLENTAGQGNDVGSRFEHLANVLDKVGETDRMGVCIDTCHAFASGYDWRTIPPYEAAWEEFDKIVGLKYLRAFHLNDCKFPLGSHRDRHAEIGKGEIGAEGFRLLMNDARFAGIPGITELPDEVTGSSLTLLKKLRERGVVD